MLNLKKITTGFPDFDEDIEYLRFGDVITWNFNDIGQYKFVAKHFADANKAKNLRIVYIHFKGTEKIFEDKDVSDIFEIDIEEGFEKSAMNVNDIIEETGNEAIYIFDNLTVLQEIWVADFMLANFIDVIAKEIAKRNSSCYFAIKSGVHSFETIERIRGVSSVVFELFSGTVNLYFLALAVKDRYNPKMFLPHKIVESENGEYISSAITNGIETAHFYSIIAKTGNQNSTRNLDSWERFFISLSEEISKQGDDVDLQKFNENFKKLLHLVFTSDPKMISILEKNLTLNDLLDIKKRMIGVGSIGGKATGMILARRIIKNKSPEVSELLEPHDSFYIGSNLYYTYLVKNNCWTLKVKQRTKSGYFPIAEILRERILEGKFSKQIEEQFTRMLQYFGKSPIIVRSSSLLEDGFGNAFPGKYESVFCVNSGSLPERLEEFEKAVKTVYASTMSNSVLEYRLKRDLVSKDEQMGLLVQRVSGSLFKDIYMPSAAGVCFSYNAYRFSPEIDPKAGVMRIVLGLGTRAVDRTKDDYPRIAALDKPDIIPNKKEYVSDYTQKKVDVLDLTVNALKTLSLDEVIDKMSSWFRKVMIERDFERERKLKEINIERVMYFTRCENIIKDERFIGSMRKILREIEDEYQYPVDLEFAVNIDSSGAFVINILQCRPLQVGGTGERKEIPKNIPEDKIFFKLNGGTMGGAYYQKIDYVVHIDPKKYYEYPYARKSTIARIIGEVNNYFKDKDKKIMFISPGRIGTSSPELGVPVSFAEISNFNVACEESYSGAGYHPELSFGSHFFLDLVEAGIFYIALYENKETTEFYNSKFFEGSKNLFSEILPDVKDGEIIDMIQITDVSNKDIKIISDANSGETVCGTIEE